MEENILVSVIVPVYNVEKYVAKCIKSLCIQTYSNIEILLIDDGSTDSSLQILNEYKEKDSRIQVFHKKNSGLGPTRNYGLEKATGTYIMYVDSDDYVMPSIVEELLKSSREHQSEISICDRYDELELTKARTLIRNEFPSGKTCVSPHEYPDIIAGISCIAMAKLYNKQFLIQHAIRQPPCKMEDVITPVTLAMAKQISYVGKPLYVYISDRKGSITNSLDFIENIDYLKILVKEFRLRGLNNHFEKQLKNIITYRASWNINKAYSLMNTRIEDYRTEIMKFLKEEDITADISMRDTNGSSKVCVIGSYNLMIVGKMLTSANATEKLEHHYSFSSMISIMSQEEPSFLNELIEGENEYRINHIIKDTQKLFKNSSKTQMKECKLILIDFLEERFPVGKLDNGTYITISDTFVRSNLNQKLKYRRIEPFSEEHMELWKDSCQRFVQLLNERYSDKTVILIKMLLADKYGEKENLKPYSDENIKKTNNGLQKYYEYFSQCYKDFPCLNIADSEYFYTDKFYRHGCYPWHLNIDMYKELYTLIKKIF